MEKTRRQFTPQQKVAILREHLVEHVPVSDLCDKHKLREPQSKARIGHLRAMFSPETGSFGSFCVPIDRGGNVKKPAPTIPDARAPITFWGRPVRWCRTKIGYEQIHTQRHLE